MKVYGRFSILVFAICVKLCSSPASPAYAESHYTDTAGCNAILRPLIDTVQEWSPSFSGLVYGQNSRVAHAQLYGFVKAPLLTVVFFTAPEGQWKSPTEPLILYPAASYYVDLDGDGFPEHKFRDYKYAGTCDMMSHFVWDPFAHVYSGVIAQTKEERDHVQNR